MSMKRSRQKSYSSRKGDDAPISFNKPTEPEKTWEQYTSQQPDEAFVPYSMKSRYEKGTLLAHPKFGKGVVLATEESRMDVLFADGHKKLGQGLP